MQKGLFMETKAGLPNSCQQCGIPIAADETWFARNIDEARSGKGICASCLVAEASPEMAIVATEPKQEPLPDFLLPRDNLTKIAGLGTTSAKKLEAAGVMTFADLASADAANLAQATGLSETKLTDWIEAANDL
jgi:predicted flap endonuclease-1-like 5' DNA nuclease